LMPLQGRVGEASYLERPDGMLRTYGCGEAWAVESGWTRTVW
jgi:hypothetical protein